MSETENKEKTIYFQYVSDLNYPIFISFSESSFEREELGLFLESMNFSPVEEEKVSTVRSDDPHFRHLKIRKAEGRIARQISIISDSDKYGSERIDNGTGYQIYRFKNCAMMVFSFRSKDWEVGVLNGFGSDITDAPSKIVINRFLSWSLGQVGVCGVWGVAVDEGMVVCRPSTSDGECVFFDLENDVFITNDGVNTLSGGFKFIRLDSTLYNTSKYMSREALLSFLPIHTTYFSKDGLTLPIRQIISTLAMTYSGVIYPADNFIPRKRSVSGVQS